jgi:hypothetical protein
VGWDVHTKTERGLADDNVTALLVVEGIVVDGVALDVVTISWEDVVANKLELSALGDSFDVVSTTMPDIWAKLLDKKLKTSAVDVSLSDGVVDPRVVSLKVSLVMASDITLMFVTGWKSCMMITSPSVTVEEDLTLSEFCGGSIEVASTKLKYKLASILVVDETAIVAMTSEVGLEFASIDPQDVAMEL